MGAPESRSVAVLAEKPSVARDIARVLGANAKGDGDLHGNGDVVTWAIGHLGARAQPCGLAGGHEPFARILAGLRRGSLGGPGADADAGDAGGARAGDSPIRARRLHGSGGYVSSSEHAEGQNISGHVAARPRDW